MTEAPRHPMDPFFMPLAKPQPVPLYAQMVGGQHDGELVPVPPIGEIRFAPETVAFGGEYREHPPPSPPPDTYRMEKVRPHLMAAVTRRLVPT